MLVYNIFTSSPSPSQVKDVYYEIWRSWTKLSELLGIFVQCYVIQKLEREKKTRTGNGLRPSFISEYKSASFTLFPSFLLPFPSPSPFPFPWGCSLSLSHFTHVPQRQRQRYCHSHHPFPGKVSFSCGKNGRESSLFWSVGTKYMIIIIWSIV